MDEFKRTLPAGYRLEIGGPVEESAKSQGPIAAVVPLMLFVMATILMIQLQSVQRLFLVLAVAPLGLIGVVAAMLPSRSPMGFVAILGVLALIGILIRNSVILIVQIEEHRREGMAALGSGFGRHDAPDAPDHVNRRRGQPRADSDFPRRLLGSHGVRDDGRHHRGHSPHASVPAGTLCRVVPGLTTDGRTRSAIDLARTSINPDDRADFFERGADCRQHGVTIGTDRGGTRIAKNLSYGQ